MRFFGYRLFLAASRWGWQTQRLRNFAATKAPCSGTPGRCPHGQLLRQNVWCSQRESHAQRQHHRAGGRWSRHQPRKAECPKVCRHASPRVQATPESSPLSLQVHSKSNTSRPPPICSLPLPVSLYGRYLPGQAHDRSQCRHISCVVTPQHFSPETGRHRQHRPSTNLSCRTCWRGWRLSR